MISLGTISGVKARASVLKSVSEGWTGRALREMLDILKGGDEDENDSDQDDGADSGAAVWRRLAQGSAVCKLTAPSAAALTPTRRAPEFALFRRSPVFIISICQLKGSVRGRVRVCCSCPTVYRYSPLLCGAAEHRRVGRRPTRFLRGKPHDRHW